MVSLAPLTVKKQAIKIPNWIFRFSSQLLFSYSFSSSIESRGVFIFCVSEIR